MAPCTAQAAEMVKRRAQCRRPGLQLVAHATIMLSDEPLNDINRAQRRPGAQAGLQPAAAEECGFRRFGGAGGSARAAPPAALQADSRKVLWRIKRWISELSFPCNSCAARRRSTPGTPRSLPRPAARPARSSAADRARETQPMQKAQLVQNSRICRAAAAGKRARGECNVRAVAGSVCRYMRRQI